MSTVATSQIVWWGQSWAISWRPFTLKISAIFYLPEVVPTYKMWTLLLYNPKIIDVCLMILISLDLKSNLWFLLFVFWRLVCWILVFCGWFLNNCNLICYFFEQGILSTEKGQRALLSFDSYERSLIQVSAILFRVFFF